MRETPVSSNASTDATRGHVDAERLAAWADRSLPAEAAAEVELHLSNCDRCQEVLAAFIRSEPVPAAVIIPFWRRRPVQWSAAGLAAAAAVVAIVSIDQSAVVPTPAATMASAPAGQQPAPPVPPPATPPAADSSSAVAAPAPPQRSRKAQPPKGQVGVAASPAASATPVAQESVTVTAAAPVASPGATAARPAVVQQLPAMAEATADRMIVASPPIEIVAPEPSASAFRAVGTGRGGGALESRSRPPGSVRWRILGGTLIQRSIDAGENWTTLRVDPQVDARLVAGAAVSPSVCWIVGRDGLVLVTTDGERFRRVSIPETVHLVSVKPESGLRATVFTTDGRKFVTTDGGASWKPDL